MQRRKRQPQTCSCCLMHVLRPYMTYLGGDTGAPLKVNVDLDSKSSLHTHGKPLDHAWQDTYKNRRVLLVLSSASKSYFRPYSICYESHKIIDNSFAMSPAGRQMSQQDTIVA